MKPICDFLCGKKPHWEEDQTEKIKKDVISTDLQDGDDLASLLRKVAGRIKVKQAAILDRNGVIEHVTSGWDLQPDDSRKLGQVMNSSPVRGLWKMAVFGEDFMCSHCDPVGTIIGHTVTREKVMAARITQNHIIVGLAPAQMPGSCLHEMKQLWEAIEARGL